MNYDSTMCWKCGSPVTESEPLPRNASCSTCGADLHSCRNCSFYEPGSHYDCHETVDELVKDKERSNFCDFFKIKREWGGANGANAKGLSKAEAARSAFQGLFGN